MTILIAHRGNVNGPAHSLENKPTYVLNTLKKFPQAHCEIDVWSLNNVFLLGHNYPQYLVDEEFLINERLWCHAKNSEAFYRMLQNPNIHCFWHQEDWYTLTSQGYIWTYPNNRLTSKSICVMPEMYDEYPDFSMCAGVCSDFLEEYLT